MNYQPFLYRRTIEHWEYFESFLTGYVSRSIPFHFDMIVKTGAHCTAVQLDFDGNNFWVYYLDAAEAIQNEPFLAKLSDLTHPNCFVAKRLNIQQDQNNCATFSIQHLNSLSYHSLKTEPLPAVFFKHSQNALFFKHSLYQHQGIHKHKALTLQDHIDKHSIMVDKPDANGVNATKQWNYSVLFKRHHYLQTALDMLIALEKSMNPSDIETILNARMCFHDNKNTTKNLPVQNILSHKDYLKTDNVNTDNVSINLNREVKNQNTMQSIEPFVVKQREPFYPIKKRNNKTTAVATLMCLGGAATAMLGMMLDSLSTNYLTKTILFLGVATMILGYIIGHEETRQPNQMRSL